MLDIMELCEATHCSTVGYYKEPNSNELKATAEDGTSFTLYPVTDNVVGRKHVKQNEVVIDYWFKEQWYTGFSKAKRFGAFGYLNDLIIYKVVYKKQHTRLYVKKATPKNVNKGMLSDKWYKDLDPQIADAFLTASDNTRRMWVRDMYTSNELKRLSGEPWEQ